MVIAMADTQRIKLRASYVTIGGCGPAYPCYVEDGNDWNGWACPWFTEATADMICRDINADLEGHLKLDKDQMLHSGHGWIKTYSEYDFAGQPEGPCEYAMERVMTPDGWKDLVPLGNCVWIWEEVD